MNKEEAIEQINYIDTLNINDMTAGQKVDMVIKNQVLDIINQIDEPKKPVIPQFVADWIEKCKEAKRSLYNALEENNEVNCWLERDEKIRENEDTFARAWLDGYEVEKEKKYKANIPNNGGACLIFAKSSIHSDRIQLISSNKRFSESFAKQEIEQAGFGWVFEQGFAEEVVE